METSEDLLTETRDGVGIITLDRPAKRNALTPAMIDGLLAATQRFERDEAIRCVLLRASGKSFMAGGDVAGFRDALLGDRETYLAQREQRLVIGHLMIHRFRRMPKPVVVAVQGAATGYGFSMLLAADYAIAADDAQFAVAHRHMGLTGDGGVSYFLPRIVGERRALEIMLLGARFDAAQALDWGLINRLVAADRLQDEAIGFACELAAGPTRALAGIKRLVRTSLDTGWDQQLAREAELIAEMFGSDDHLEGVTAFLEKRRPSFSGR
ncbi:enoyl-CoA hydratase/isomerase family protein [Sphingomonas profundi]|uniref:enoyl-CoA hydratase/isomerase family protein n=1 Tax=Alterirhizorhabdus profundi TaxID=2681549 RepID=UPI0018D18002|nr:enoyl-CoA hydratase-related protein [Sphingomonas profundi]